jgi:prophage regulatory protein
MEEIKFIRLPEVIKVTGLSRSMLYLLMKRGDFPPPIKLGLRASAWIASDVSAWQRSKINGGSNVKS